MDIVLVSCNKISPSFLGLWAIRDGVAGLLAVVAHISWVLTFVLHVTRFSTAVALRVLVGTEFLPIRWFVAKEGRNVLGGYMIQANEGFIDEDTLSDPFPSVAGLGGTSGAEALFQLDSSAFMSRLEFAPDCSVFAHTFPSGPEAILDIFWVVRAVTGFVPEDLGGVGVLHIFRFPYGSVSAEVTGAFSICGGPIDLLLNNSALARV